MAPHKRTRSRSNSGADRGKKPKDAVSAPDGHNANTSGVVHATDSQLSTRATAVSLSQLSTSSSPSVVLLPPPVQPVGEGEQVADAHHGVGTHSNPDNTLNDEVDALLNTSHPVYVSIPLHAHAAWRVACERLFSAYAAAADIRTKEKVVLQILQLPQNTIRLCSSGRLIHQITQGVRVTHVSAPPSAVPAQPLDGVSKQVKRAIIHIINGDVRRANNVLRQETGIAPRNHQTMNTLKQLHPPPSAPLPPLPDSAPTAVAIDVKVLRKLIRAHCSNTAAGDSASGWRNIHLLPLVTSVKCMQGLALMLVDIINGEFTGAVKRVLTACTLLPLSKPGGGVRPIGIGNTFVRLAKIYATKMSSCDLNSMFPSIQLGAGHKNGCERVVHALQAFHKRAAPGNVICSTDIKNAFNTRRRCDMWDALVKQPSCQPLLRMVHWAYSDASQLCVYEGSKLYATVPSAEGVVQGDPLASLMFALSMQPIYEQCIADTNGQVQALAIQDDLYLMGPAELVVPCLTKLQTLCGNVGLTLAVNKCQVIPCHRNALQDASDVHIKSIETVCSDAGVRVVDTMPALGIVLTNVDGGLGRFIKDKVDQYRSYFDLLCHDTMPQQMAYRLLRDSANPSMNYVTRVCHTEEIKDGLNEWDTSVSNAFWRMHHIDIDSHGVKVSKQRRGMIQLPMSLGGMGLRSMHDAAHAAYTASLYTAYPDIKALNLEAPTDASALDGTTDSAAALIKSNTMLPTQYMMSERGVDVLDIADVATVQELCESPKAQLKLQHKLMKEMNESLRHQLMVGAEKNHIAAVLSASQPHASRWLLNMFDSGDVMFKPALWDAAVRHRLFIQPADIMCSDMCECGQGQSQESVRRVQTFTDQPAHFHVCDRMKGYLKQRHDRCVSVLCKELRQLGATVTLEPTLKPSSHTSIQCMRADLLVVTAQGKKYVDISIVCPAGQEYVNQHGSYRTEGKSCEVASNDKVIKYTGKMPDDCTDSDFVPLVYETYGGMCKKGLSWLKSVCKELSDEPASALEHILNVMSATLQMGNGQVDVDGMIQHRIGQRAVRQSASLVYQTHVASLLHRYMTGAIRLDWLGEARRRPGVGQMREEAEAEERKGNEEE